MTPNNEEIKKIHFTKDFPNDIFGFRKWITQFKYIGVNNKKYLFELKK